MHGWIDEYRMGHIIIHIHIYAYTSGSLQTKFVIYNIIVMYSSCTQVKLLFKCE